MTRPVIEIVGSLNTDLVTTTSRVPGPGETILATSFSTGFGGKGANQAVACARLVRQSASDPAENDILVAMRGAVGDDIFGSNMTNHLKSEGIDVSQIKVKQSYSTGTAVILVEEGTGENRILVTAGANGQLVPENVEFSTAKSGFHLTIFQLEIPIETVLECMSKAKSQGAEVLLNPAPAIALPEKIYASIDHLVLNESEASILSGVPEAQLEKSLDKVAEYFCSKGVRNVIVTLGAKGVFVRTSANVKEETSGQFIKGHQVPVVDTTAAGDTFVGAYASYLARNISDDTIRAVEFANLAGSMAVRKAGAQASIPFLGDLPARESMGKQFNASRNSSETANFNNSTGQATI